MAEENAMDRGASAALKNQDLTDGIYEDASTDASRGVGHPHTFEMQKKPQLTFFQLGASQASSATGSDTAFDAGAASGADSISEQSATTTATSQSEGSGLQSAVQSAADKVMGNK
ncbi:hypothetical protein DOTSEDRAFT_21011 [Dothistroma septosporum NZE10]|uniref:SMP domain-containing protein n=1 Tax=Dothistroma septosporum (strain NZE10 / CBS 128990) TaxID=675120 RepID=N1PYC5_DOTSN|nr:hypothetical protein DOTSEDRAFT_21011 [Dothistroma septosporum NZE10]